MSVKMIFIMMDKKQMQILLQNGGKELCKIGNI